MINIKSPFIIHQNFLSGKACEQIVGDLGFLCPDYDKDGNPIKTVRHHHKSEEAIFHKIEPHINSIIEYYDPTLGYQGTETMTFEYFSEGFKHTVPQCENSNWVKKKWVRTKNRDLTGIIFLSDHNNNPPFDTDFEVYGGKLEFPQHHFGFNPERGTLILFPSDPHFINATAEVSCGDLFQVRFHISTTLPYIYQPNDFPGNYRTWFKHLSG